MGIKQYVYHREEYFGVNILLFLIIYANWIKVHEYKFALLFISKNTLPIVSRNFKFSKIAWRFVGKFLRIDNTIV